MPECGRDRLGAWRLGWRSVVLVVRVNVLEVLFPGTVGHIQTPVGFVSGNSCAGLR